MTDLSKTDAQWDRLLQRELCLPGLAPIRYLREVRDRFKKSRTQVRVINDADGNVGSGGVTLAGVDPGSNTTPAGKLFARITGSGPYTVTLYTAAGASGEVASGSAAANATASLTASNSSGLTGTFNFAASVTAIADDTLQLEAVLDYPAQLPKVFTQADGIEDDGDSDRIYRRAYATCAQQIEAAIATMEQAIQDVAIGDDLNPTGRFNDFASANETALATDVAKRDSSGNTTRVRGGIFHTIREAMADEGTGSTQYVLKRVPSAAAGVAGSNNQGLGVIASHTPKENCQAGLVTLKCVDATIGTERFDGYFYIEATDRKTPVSGLQVGQTWSGPNGLGPITLTRTLSKTGDVGSNTDLGAVTGFSASGENSGNTDDGTLYWSIVANSSNWDLSFFKSSSRASDKLVSKATNIATAAAFTSSAQNGSGLEITGTIGSGPTTTTTGTLLLNPFRVENSSGVPDQFTIAVTVASSPGLVQTILSQHFNADGSYLNSTTSGSETLDDDYARANTFAAFTVEDN